MQDCYYFYIDLLMQLHRKYPNDSSITHIIGAGAEFTGNKRNETSADKYVCGILHAHSFLQILHLN